jgi:maltose-binding protein MalE
MEENYMKKSISILFALLVIASMALASCAQPTPETIVQTVVVTEVVEVEGETVVETQIVEVVVTPEPEPEMEEETVLRIMSLPWPQTPVEQELADELFTPATGIKVEITGPPYDFVESKMRELCASQSSEFDIYETDSQWYGGIIQSGCIEPLDPYLEASGIDYDATFVQPYATYNGRWPVPNAVLRGDEPWEDYTDQPVYFMLATPKSLRPGMSSARLPRP